MGQLDEDRLNLQRRLFLSRRALTISQQLSDLPKEDQEFVLVMVTNHLDLACSLNSSEK